MRLSRRSDYALRAVIDLALRAEADRVQLREIAARQAIPEKYLEQLLRLLKTSGVVLSTRGSRGGYRLARPAGEMSVLDVIEAVEGPLDTDHHRITRNPGAKVVQTFWEDLTAGLRERMGEVTIAVLVERYEQQRESGDDWVI